MLLGIKEGLQLAGTTITSSEAEQTAKDTIDFFQHFKENILTNAKVFIEALLILVIGWWIVNLICRIIQKSLAKSKLDASAAGFIHSILKYTLRVLLFIVVISKLGVDMTSIIAVFTSAALAIGLALQGSLSNIAGGLLLIIVKPFRAGDYIIDGEGHEGTVQTLELIYTKLLSIDGRTVWVPNGTLAGTSITNLSSEKQRSIDFNFGIDYSEDIDKVRRVLLDMVKTSDYVLEEPAPIVFVKEFESSSVAMVMRVSCKGEDYWPAKFELQEKIKKTFDANGIVIPYEHLEVTIAK